MADKSFSNKAVDGAKGCVGCCASSCIDFRDFVLRGNVVDLAVAVVVGGAFKELVNAFIASFITPLLGMIGTGDSNSLYFVANGSKFPYGLFITALLTFLIVCFICFYAIVLPLMALLGRVYPHLATVRSCPECYSDDIPGLATRCKFCAASLTPTQQLRKRGAPVDESAEVVSKSTTSAPAPATMAV